MVSAGVSSMKSGTLSSRAEAWMKRSNSSCPTSPRRILVARHARFLGQHASRELLGRHFQREEPDDAAIFRHDLAGGLSAGPIGLGDVEGDVGGEGRLAHRRPAGKDQQVGRVEAAELAVHVAEAGREAARLARALIGLLGETDRGGERLVEGLEPAIGIAGGGEIEQLLLGDPRSARAPRSRSNARSCH